MAFKMNPKSPVLMATGKFESPAKNMNKGYGPAKTSSPAKKNGMKYDIKEASNQNLTAKARKHFAENAQHDSKKGSR